MTVCLEGWGQVRIGIIEVIALPAEGTANAAYNSLLVKQYASIMPQAIAVWCRRLGHRVFYATYYGNGDLISLVPHDIDVLFVSCYTKASSLAYALARFFRPYGTRLIVGGPHARSFPVDCLRFFDIVVQSCSNEVVAAILRDDYEPGSVVSSDGMPTEIPPVAERAPYILQSAFSKRKHREPLSVISLLASTGCPYTCDFCTDWNSPYLRISEEQLRDDLYFVGRNFHNVPVAFHDPNFGVQFDSTMSVLESVPDDVRPRYMIESSLTILRGERMPKLKATRCMYVAPGIESWGSYSNKAGAGRMEGRLKLDRVVEQMSNLRHFVPYIQANFIYGLDSDRGSAPAHFTQEFMDLAPYVWPVINIPVPFGGTPMFESLQRESRVLKSMPFTFYYSPFLTMVLKNYDIVDYYRSLVSLLEHASSVGMLRRRLRASTSPNAGLVHVIRTAAVRGSLVKLRSLLSAMLSDRNLRDFHSGRQVSLPRYYDLAYDRALGKYGALLARSDRFPDHSSL